MCPQLNFVTILQNTMVSEQEGNDTPNTFTIHHLGKTLKCVKVTLAVLAVITLLLTAAILLSLIRLINITDLNNNMTFYHSQDVTLLTGGVFDLRNYDRVNIYLRSKFDFNVTVCQAHCSKMSHLMNSVTLYYNDTVNITQRYPSRRYMKMIDTKTGSLYMLKGSEVTFMMELQGSENSSGVTLYIFNDVRFCDDFFDNPSQIHRNFYNTVSLNISNNIAASHTVVAVADDYICVVAEFVDYTVYRYSVNGSVYQYYNVSYLANQDLCAFNDPLTTQNDDSELSFSLDHSLERPLSSVVAPNKQQTCILVTISSSLCPCRTNVMSWTIFATLKTPGVIATFVLSAIVFSVFILSGLCFFCLSICPYR